MRGAREKIVIDTDPGVDDALTICAAVKAQELDVVAITTIFGNCPTRKSYENAGKILQIVNRNDIPVYMGSESTFAGEMKIRIADFVHGDDGLGNVGAKYFGDREGDMPTACRTGRAIDYLVEVTSGAGGQERITILALGPLTNVAFALKANPSMRAKVVWLGGAFHVNGNVNPSAEANVFCDPAAADFVLSSEAVKSGALDVYIVPLDVTQRCMFSDLNLSSIKEEAQRRAMGSTGIDVPGLEVCAFLQEMSQFYLQFHTQTYGLHYNAMMLHDPTALVAVIKPDLFYWKSGAVVVSSEEGPLKGMTVRDEGKKCWRGQSPWTTRGCVQVAVDVDERKVVQIVDDLLRSFAHKMATTYLYPLSWQRNWPIPVEVPTYCVTNNGFERPRIRDQAYRTKYTPQRGRIREVY